MARCMGVGLESGSPPRDAAVGARAIACVRAGRGRTTCAHTWVNLLPVAPVLLCFAPSTPRGDRGARGESSAAPRRRCDGGRGRGGARGECSDNNTRECKRCSGNCCTACSWRHGRPRLLVLLSLSAARGGQRRGGGGAAAAARLVVGVVSADAVAAYQPRVVWIVRPRLRCPSSRE